MRGHDGRMYSVRVRRASNAVRSVIWRGSPILVLALALIGCGSQSESAPEPIPNTATDTRPVMLFLGTSLTAGYGLPSSEAFPALIQDRLDTAGYDFRVVNAGVSGDTSAGGLRRLDWLLRLPIAVMVLELGGNDMLRGLDVGALHDNLSSILAKTRAAHPDTRFVIAGMRVPRNFGRSYVDAFEAVYPALAQENDARLVPFLLEGVAGDPALNLPDRIHPNARGHARIAETVWGVLGPVMIE